MLPKAYAVYKLRKFYVALHDFTKIAPRSKFVQKMISLLFVYQRIESK